MHAVNKCYGIAAKRHTLNGNKNSSIDNKNDPHRYVIAIVIPEAFCQRSSFDFEYKKLAKYIICNNYYKLDSEL